jgi:stage II sporulation protein D
MRRFILGVTCVGSLLALTGCAIGLQAAVPVPAYTAPQAPETVRVRVLYTSSPAGLSCTGAYQFQLRNGGNLYVRHGTTRARAMHGALVFGQKSFKGDVVVMPAASTDTLKLNGRGYRGTLVFHPAGGSRYDVVEYLSAEEYLYGVLPKEVEPTWPADALKAQAVVSRTYVLYNKMRNAAERFDVSNSVLDQVYGGQNVEAPESNRAVDDTRGQTLEDSTGKPVQAFFHSSCGGHTELPEHVWKSSNPNDVFGVVSDGDYCSADPHYKWHYTLSLAALRTRLRRAGLHLREIQDLTVLQKSESGRAEIFLVRSGKQEIEVGSNRFRLAVGPDGMRSTLLTTMKVGKKTVSFEGRGWGHGVGLCQWGARGRALAGQSYKTILETYYPKAKLAKVPSPA